MSNKKQTALQQAIAELKKKSTKGGMMVQSLSHQFRAEGKEEGIDIALKILESKLELEKQQIIKDYCNGRMSVIDKEIIPAEQYYNDTYGND